MVTSRARSATVLTALAAALSVLAPPAGAQEVPLPPPPPGDVLPPPVPPPPMPACRADGGPVAVRTSPSYAVVSRSSAVTLSARLLQDGRVCQAGLPVRVYARGPGGRTFHLSRTLTTDAQGLVRTTYRPTGDFRWFARSVLPFGTTQSSTGLVQVRR